MKNLIVLSIILLSGTVLFGSEFRSGDDVTINDPVRSDLYIGAGNIQIEAPVFGDLLIGGGDITISDSVMNDLMIGGGDITINGYVGDDIRVAGGDITITGNVGGDIILFGGDLSIRSDSISGDLVMFGGSLDINSHIGGKVMLYGGDATINGSVAGDLLGECGDLTVGAEVYGTSKLVAGDLDLVSTAAFHDDVEYWTGKGEINFNDAMVSGTATYNKGLKSEMEGKASGPKAFMKLGALFYLWSFFAGVIMIIILHFIFKRLWLKSGSIYQEQLLMNFFYGFLFYIVVPVIVVVAFITVIGIPVGLVLLALYLIVLMLTTSISSLILANWINFKWSKNWSTGILLLVAIVTLLFLKFINMIPFLGWLLVMIICCTAIGTLVQQGLNRRKAIAEGA